MRQTKAFTLVELLIAIVVIAILASISAVAYSGVQQRATNSAVLAGLESVEKFWKLYYTQNGQVLRLHPQDVQDASSQSSYITDPYYTEITERAGVCITSGWPSSIAANNWEAKWDYCDSRPNNSGINRGLATELFDKAVRRSGELANALPKMPVYDGVDLWPTDRPNPIRQRGIRLANITIHNKTYLFYGLYGKQCSGSDRRVNFTSTQWIDYYYSNGQDIAPANFDNDFTQNNTVYCARTLRW